MREKKDHIGGDTTNRKDDSIMANAVDYNNPENFVCEDYQTTKDKCGCYERPRCPRCGCTLIKDGRDLVCFLCEAADVEANMI